MSQGLVAGKAAIVTGAGRGIGRAIALALAAEGAAVTVVDIGVALDGSGGDQGPAHDVAGEIEAKGGRAVASTLSIAEPKNAEAIVETTLAAFGRVDILVNNAGILRDRMFHKMSHLDWMDVIQVNLNGAFNMARAVAGHFREQDSGAMVHMTSTSGLIGNFGQANYMAAKLGLAGLSRGIALDLARHKVRSNCIAPFAWSRMTSSIPAETDAEKERVARLQRMTPRKTLRSPCSWLPTRRPTFPDRSSRCATTRSCCSASRARCAPCSGAAAGRRARSPRNCPAPSRRRSRRWSAPATCSLGIRFEEVPKSRGQRCGNRRWLARPNGYAIAI